MTENAEAGSKPLWAKCNDCGHTWAAAYYPGAMDRIFRIMEKHADCPKCDGKGYLAKQKNGVLLEGGDAQPPAQP